MQVEARKKGARTMLAAVLAVVAGSAVAWPVRSAGGGSHRRRTSTHSMVTAPDNEIAAWNEEVERRRAAKKGVDRGI